jgi:hypothetical protein
MGELQPDGDGKDWPEKQHDRIFRIDNTEIEYFTL